MKNIINKLNNALNEGRALNEKEFFDLIIELLNIYGVSHLIKEIKIDRNNLFKEIAGFDGIGNCLYFNIDLITKRINEEYWHQQTPYTFNEFFVLQQLSIVLHEIRHIMQLKGLLNDNKAVKEVINDCDSVSNNAYLYNYLYNIFPIEKDATIFSCYETIRLVKECKYFKKDRLRMMYLAYFYRLIEGYHLTNSKDGLVKEFYEIVMNDLDKFNLLQNEIEELTLHDKMSFGFSLNDSEVEKLKLIPSLISKNNDPKLVLKRK